MVTRNVKWICCENDEHGGWEATFAVRHAGGGKCPVCSRSRPVKGINTFADVYPDYLPLWAPSNTRKPDETFFDSSLWLRWICPTCRGEYGAYIKDVIFGEKSCPYCNDRCVLPGLNSLADIYPEIAKQWSPNNDQQSDHVLANSKVWAKWICPMCRGEYRAVISEMVDGTATCPYCEERQVLPGFNSFAAKHQDLMAEWDDIGNYLLSDPDCISDSSNTPVWWICQKDEAHRYIMTPAQRLVFQKRNQEPCPYCKGLRRKRRHFI